MRSLEAKHRQEAQKVSSSRKQAAQTGASIAQEDSAAYQGDWHLWDIFRQMVKGSNADQLEQEGMGIVSQSAVPGVQPAVPKSSQSAPSDDTQQDLTDTPWCPQDLPNAHHL